MSTYKQLASILDQLKQNTADEETISLVERFMKAAETADEYYCDIDDDIDCAVDCDIECQLDKSITQGMVIAQLLRQHEALNNDTVYNDLQKLASDRKGNGIPNTRSYFQVKTRIRQSRKW